MKTFRLIGIALLAIVLCVNFTSCSSDDDSTEEDVTDLSKIIIGTWVQDGDDDVMVIKSDGTVTWYENEADYKDKEISQIYQWNVSGEWLKFYYKDRLIEEMRPQEVKANIIIWKRYDDDDYADSSDYTDSYGNYDLWTWERYNK